MYVCMYVCMHACMRTRSLPKCGVVALKFSAMNFFYSFRLMYEVMKGNKMMRTLFFLVKGFRLKSSKSRNTIALSRSERWQPCLLPAFKSAEMKLMDRHVFLFSEHRGIGCFSRSTDRYSHHANTQLPQLCMSNKLYQRGIQFNLSL